MRLVDIEKIQNKCLNLTICDGYEKNYINAMYKIMKNAPTVNAKKVVYAKWIYDFGWKCSGCGWKQPAEFDSVPNDMLEHCPKCGAIME